MKVKYKSIIMFIVIILVLMECEFNYMLPLGILSSPESVKLLKAILCLLALFLYRVKCQHVKISKELRIVEGLFVLIIPINIIVSIATGMKPLDALLSASHYFFIFLIEPVCYLLFEKTYRDRLIKIVLAGGCVTLILRCIMAFYYHYNNNAELFPKLSLSASSKIRYSDFFGYNMLRVYPSCFGAVVLFGFAYIALVAPKKWQRLISVIVAGFTYAYYALIYQTRSYMVIFIIELFILILFKRYKKNKSIKTVAKYIVVVVTVCFVWNTAFMQNLLNSFSVDSELGDSTTIRLVGFGLMMSKIVTSFPFGIGGNNGFESFAGLIYADDYGCLDFIVKNNILGLLVYLLLCIYFCVNLYRTRGSQYNLLMLTVVCVFVSSMLCVDNFLPRKIGAVPFIIALFEYCRIQAHSCLKE